MGYYKADFRDSWAPERLSEGQQPAESAGMTVTELNAIIAGALRADPRTRNVTVTAEVSSFKKHLASGHWYFSLKDENSAVSCVMFRQNNRPVKQIPKDGDRVTVTGFVELYARDGKVQLYVMTLRPAGIGGLYERFEALKRKLDAEGLFDPARKRILPMLPRKVAVITSASGAALHDILNVSGRRNPGIPLVLVPSGVQGDGAAAEITSALDRAGRLPGTDVIILARGGGSAEDLWCFNEEIVARAIARCPIPVVTGIGHEVDFTISDFAADVRASTPSNAAEIVFPDRKELRERIGMMREAMSRAAEGMINRAALRVREEQRKLARLSPERRIRDRAERLYRSREALSRASERRLKSAAQELRITRLELCHQTSRSLETAESRLTQTRTRLKAISPLGVLERGYALVYGEEKRMIKRAAEAETEMTLRFADGTVHVTRKDTKTHA